MYAVHPYLNSSKIDLLFITDILMCLPGYGYFHFSPSLKITFALQVVKLSSLKCMCTWIKISKISLKVKNRMVQKMFWKGGIVSTTWGIATEHFCKFALFNQSSKTVLSNHLYVTLLIFMSGFFIGFIYLVFYCFCTIGLNFRIIVELYIIISMFFYLFDM